MPVQPVNPPTTAQQQEPAQPPSVLGSGLIAAGGALTMGNPMARVYDTLDGIDFHKRRDALLAPHRQVIESHKGYFDRLDTLAKDPHANQAAIAEHLKSAPEAAFKARDAERRILNTAGQRWAAPARLAVGGAALAYGAKRLYDGLTAEPPQQMKAANVADFSKILPGRGMSLSTLGGAAIGAGAGALSGDDSAQGGLSRGQRAMVGALAGGLAGKAVQHYGDRRAFKPFADKKVGDAYVLGQHTHVLGGMPLNEAETAAIKANANVTTPLTPQQAGQPLLDWGNRVHTDMRKWVAPESSVQFQSLHPDDYIASRFARQVESAAAPLENISVARPREFNDFELVRQAGSEPGRHRISIGERGSDPHYGDYSVFDRKQITQQDLDAIKARMRAEALRTAGYGAGAVATVGGAAYLNNRARPSAPKQDDGGQKTASYTSWVFPRARFG